MDWLTNGVCFSRPVSPMFRRSYVPVGEKTRKGKKPFKGTESKNS
jgi:hypothetical protein